MESKLAITRFYPSLGLVCVFGVTSALAQVTPPNAGSLSTIPVAPPTAPAKSPTFEVQQEIRPALVTPGGVKVTALSFKISGNTVFTETVLADLLHDMVGKELDLAGLDQAAGTISQYYRERGYLVARAYLPVQDISSGNLEIAVIEGRLGAVKFNRSADVRLTDERAETLVAGAAPLNAPLNEQNIERALLLLNDLPGVDVKSTLIPGATPGTSDLVVETTEGSRVTGSADADNYGNKYTGTLRVGATLNLNDPLRSGDQLIVRGLTTGQGMKYGRIAYAAPVGDMGTKIGVALSRMDYRLGKDFAALNAVGQSTVSSIYAVQPFIRSRNNNLYGTLTYDSKRLSDDQNNIGVTNKRIGVFALGLSGDMRDGLGGGGVSAGSLSFASGSLNVGGNVSYAANDAITARTNGTYSKVIYSGSRLQHIDDWSFYAGIAGQNTNKNLDSSEKFVLGGLGVRAYPQGEAAGDSGVLVNLEARYTVPGFDFGSVQVLGFIDTGSVTLHKTTWAGWQPVGVPGYRNNYSLSGAGIGLNVFKAGDFSVRTSLAWKLGINPGRDALGRDSDGATNNMRFWIQLTKQF